MQPAAAFTFKAIAKAFQLDLAGLEKWLGAGDLLSRLAMSFSHPLNIFEQFSLHPAPRSADGLHCLSKKTRVKLNPSVAQDQKTAQ